MREGGGCEKIASGCFGVLQKRLDVGNYACALLSCGTPCLAKYSMAKGATTIYSFQNGLASRSAQTTIFPQNLLAQKVFYDGLFDKTVVK